DRVPDRERPSKRRRGLERRPLRRRRARAPHRAARRGGREHLGGERRSHFHGAVTRASRSRTRRHKLTAMNASEQAQWITARARVLLLMRRALAATRLEDLLAEGSADEEPAPIRNALMLHERGE